MNSSELSVSVTKAIVNFHYYSGVIFFVINISVCLIIIFDRDSRGKVYRKYLISLQLTSTLIDLLGNAYTPILLVNCRVVFSDSIFAQYIDIVTFAAIEVCLFGGLANAYFACVYYRRSAVLPEGSRFCFTGWRQIALFLTLQIVAFVNTIAFFVIGNNSRADGKNIPNVVNWLMDKPSYIFVQESNLFFKAGAVTVTYYLGLAVVLAIMIGQVMLELKNGMRHASATTKRYQRRAVVSLALQGVVPKAIYIAPIIVEVVLYMNTMSMGLEEAAMEKTTSTASALVFCVITSHTVLHSLTILICSPSYRRTILDFILSRLERNLSNTTVTPVTSVIHSGTKPNDKL